MNCPECRSLMHTAAYEGADIFTCDACGGEFLGPHELAHIIATRDIRFSEAQRECIRGFSPLFGAPAPRGEQSLDCPACANAMEKINYGGDSGVHVDRCPVCTGMWLQNEELEKLQMLTERWQEAAPAQLAAIASNLEAARRVAANSTTGAFTASRFSFVNAIMNRLLDAA